MKGVGGALKAKGLNRRRKQRRGNSMQGGIEPPLIKLFVLENAFQAIYIPIFPYAITSILSKVVHSKTLFLTISFAFPCRPLGALVRFPCGGRGHINCNACLSQPNVQKNSRAHVRGSGGGGGA